MAAAHRVLVTGSAGAIGQPVCAELRSRGHWVRGLDVRTTTEHVDDSLTGDIADPAIIDRAMAGVDSVVHLAACVDEADFLEQLLQPNIIGVYNVFNSARHHELRRVVVASSIQVVMGQINLAEKFVRANDVAPRNHYSVTKLFAENMADMYHRKHDMSVIAARICWMTRNADEARYMLRTKFGKAYFLSPLDAGRFFRCAIEAEDVGFAVLYACGPGDGERQLVDIEPARELIGYDPQDVYPQGLPFDVPPE